MAEEQQQGNIRQEFNSATVGLNMDQSVNQIKPGTLTYALNAAVENFDASSVNYQNEPGNELCVSFPDGYSLIGSHFIQERNKVIFFIVNSSTGQSEIGQMIGNDCVYRTIVNADCLNFNIDYPIHKVVHRITNCSTEIYWTDGLNARRYMDIDNVPYVTEIIPNTCGVFTLNELDCNKLKIQPNFNIPQLEITDVISGGDLVAGTYQFAVQYADAQGNPFTSYYSVTNPTPIADPNFTSVNFNYPVGKSIVIDVTNLDVSGKYQYYNLAVIKTINAISSVELVGTYFIDNFTQQITYTGQNKTDIRLSINDIFEKFPYYDVAQDITVVQDILVWDQLTAIDRVNYQKIANQITLQWESWRIPSTENYADEFNATNLRGYLRDEVYSFEIVFLLKNGKQTDGFHIPGRRQTNNEVASQPDVPNTNPDFIGEGTSAPYWKIYNTASVTGTYPEYSPDPSYKGPYQYGQFAYWESTETYPCNVEVWGELANQQIRHHKFPDILISPAFESSVPVIVSDKYQVELQQSSAVYPLGVKINNQQIIQLVQESDLTNEEKDDVVGYKIVRGDRGTNKSIIAKGILRNVGSYVKEEETYYYPNYPYNDLKEDPFLNANNNAYFDSCQSFDIIVRKFNKVDEKGSYVEVRYIDCNTNKEKTEKIYELHFESNPYKLCSLSKPTFLGEGVFNKIEQQAGRKGPIAYGYASYQNNPSNPFGYVPEKDKCVAYSRYSNYDVWEVEAENGRAGMRACWNDPVEGPIRGPWCGSGKGLLIYVRVDTSPTRCEGKRWNADKLREVRDPGCKEEEPLKPLSESLANRQIFNSPETSFGQPFLGQVIKLENVMYGGGKAHFVEVKDNAKYRLLSKEAQQVALNSSKKIGGSDINAVFAAYQAYLEIYINGITRKNYAYSFNSVASYNYHSPVYNNIGIKQRSLDIKRYLIPGLQNVGDDFNINNYNRETSVYLKTDESLPFPSKTNSLLYLGNSLIEDNSRFTIGETGACATPQREQDINVVSYYGSIKNIVPGQWGQIYSYKKVDTGFQIMFSQFTPVESTVFGGDTFISKFAFKTKLPFFLENRVNAPDDSDVFYDAIGNIAYPKYWHSARSVLTNATAANTQLVNFISYKAHNFDCPNATEEYTSNTSPSELTYYDGYFYMFAYGVPSFYCESSYNTDLRQAFNNREGDFWPHVSTGIPDDWVQQSFVPIEQDNTYYYNVTFSKQNRENEFTNLPIDWKGVCSTNYPFRAIYSDVQGTVLSTGVTLNDANNKINNWLIYRAVSYFDFPQNYGNLVSLDGIQNKAILARFENKSLLYNNLLTIDTSNPQAAYVGNNKLFAGAPPIDFAETDLGYVGTQNVFLLKIPQGQITVDAKRGQIFLISGTQAVDLTAFGSGVNRFMTDHLPFKILRYFRNVDVDNHFNGIGLHGVYDAKFDRVIITKLDYVPLDEDIKYDEETKEFYIENTINNVVFRDVVYLDDSEFFCNKSFTISFNFNTKSWVSFHSYVPNFYIAENNFFYSGLNGCCDSVNGEATFTALIGTLTRDIPTTTSTTTSVPIPLPTTTTTTTVLDCTLNGTVIETLCNLEGDAIITVPPTTTTTICQRPFGVQGYNFVTGYIDLSLNVIDTTVSLQQACSGVGLFNDESVTFEFTSIEVSVIALEIGQTVYENIFDISCNVIPDGWYYTDESANSEIVYHVENGVIIEIAECSCSTITTTTTIQPIMEECCDVIVNSSSNLSILKQDGTVIDLDVPEYISAKGIAINNTLLWSLDTEVKEWNITLDPFTTIFNRAISLPLGFTINSGIVAISNDVLIAITDSTTPQEVVEINISGTSAVITTMFTLQTDREATSNILYTTNGKLIVVNQDVVTSDYYISQYDYVTTTLEYDVLINNIGGIILYECNCNIYLIDKLGDLYMLNNDGVFNLLYISNTGLSLISGSQIMDCVTVPLGLTTTTSSSSTSTTTTTTTSI